MRRGAFLVALAALCGPLVGCVTAPPPLYAWGDFSRVQYETLKSDGASPVQHIDTLRAQALKAQAEGQALPPGFRAHQGMLALVTDDAASARQFFEQEKAVFPESAPYMDRLIQRLTAPPAGAAAAEPAPGAPPARKAPRVQPKKPK